MATVEEDLKKLKSFMAVQSSKVHNFLSNPEIKKASRIAQSVLDTAYKLKQAELAGIAHLAMTGFGVASSVIQNLDGSYGTYDRIVKKAQSHGLVQAEMYSIANMYKNQNLFVDAEVLWEDDSYQFAVATIKDMKIGAVFFKKEAVGSIVPWLPQFVNEKASNNRAEMLDNLWKMVGAHVQLTTNRDNQGNDTLAVVAIKDLSKLNIFNTRGSKHDPDELVMKFNAYKSKGISRAYMLCGPPGSGKTTFCYNLARKLGGRLMLIAPEIFERQEVTINEVSELIKTFSPTVLVFDDIDRVSTEKNKILLSLLDLLRKEIPDTLVVSTVNDEEQLVDALKRPGRLGAILRFEAPNVDERREVIRSHCASIGIDRDLTHLADLMDHPNFTQDYIKECCEQALVCSDEEIIAYIEETIEKFGGSTRKRKKKKSSPKESKTSEDDITDQMKEQLRKILGTRKIHISRT